MDCFPWKMLTDNLDTPGLGLIFFRVRVRVGFASSFKVTHICNLG